MGWKAKSGYDDGDQKVYLHHLHSYVLDNVRKWSQRTQNPFLSLPRTVQSFALAPHGP